MGSHRFPAAKTLDRRMLELGNVAHEECYDERSKIARTPNSQVAKYPLAWKAKTVIGTKMILTADPQVRVGLIRARDLSRLLGPAMRSIRK